MKKIIYTPVLLLFSISLLFLSCNKEEDNNSTSGNAKVDSFLKSFYNKKVQIGKTLETKIIKPSISTTSKSVEYEDVKLTEVFVEEEERARGYVVTDLNTDEFLYFADVNREDYKLTTFDVEKNEIFIKENINQLQEWAKSNGFDMIKLYEEYIAEVSSGNLTARRFWGWGDMYGGPCEGGVRIMYHIHYIFGIGGSPKPVKSLDGSSLQEPCGESVLGEN